MLGIKYLVEMTTSALLLQFQGSLSRWVVWGIRKHNYHPSTPNRIIVKLELEFEFEFGVRNGDHLALQWACIAPVRRELCFLYAQGERSRLWQRCLCLGTNYSLASHTLCSEGMPMESAYSAVVSEQVSLWHQRGGLKTLWCYNECVHVNVTKTIENDGYVWPYWSRGEGVAT